MDVPAPDSQPRPEIPDTPSLELLQRAQAGDPTALDQLCARYLAPLRRWAHSRLPARARDLLATDDLVQETLLRTLKHIDGFEPRRPGALQAYLRQAIANRVRDEIRRVARIPGHDGNEETLVSSDPSPLEALIGAQALARYESALQRLGDEERAAVVARVELGCSYAEIGAELGQRTPDAARMMVSRALIRLAREMADGV